MAQPTAASEDSLTDTLALYEARGYSGQFGAAPGGRVMCYSCRAATPVRLVPVTAFHRLEGTSDPNEEAIVAAVACPSCSAQGTIMLPYGPGAPPEDAAVLAGLQGLRGGSFRPGL